jgi:hypothetical protein
MTPEEELVFQQVEHFLSRMNSPLLNKSALSMLSREDSNYITFKYTQERLCSWNLPVQDPVEFLVAKIRPFAQRLTNLRILSHNCAGTIKLNYEDSDSADLTVSSSIHWLINTRTGFLAEQCSREQPIDPLADALYIIRAELQYLIENFQSFGLTLSFKDGYLAFVRKNCNREVFDQALSSTLENCVRQVVSRKSFQKSEETVVHQKEVVITLDSPGVYKTHQCLGRGVR